MTKSIMAFKSQIKTNTIAEKKKDTELSLDKELMFLFISQGFTQIYYDEVKSKPKDVKKLLVKLAKKSFGFSKRLQICINKGNALFEQAEDNLRNKPKSRFGRSVVLDENGDVGLHGLLFSVAIILEHRNLENRNLVLPYDDAQRIYDNFTELNDICHNALLVAKEFTELVKGL